MADVTAIREKAAKLRGRRYLEHNDEFFGEVRIQSLTARERRQIHSVIRDDYSQVFGWWVYLTVVDENGERCFAESDVDGLNETDNKYTDDLMAAILSHVDPDIKANTEDEKKSLAKTGGSEPGTN